MSCKTTGCKVKKAYTSLGISCPNAYTKSYCWLLMQVCISTEMSHNAYTNRSIYSLICRRYIYIIALRRVEVPTLYYCYSTYSNSLCARHKCTESHVETFMVPLILLCNLSCLAQGKIFKHTVDMFHGTISWKIKSSFNRNFEKISTQLPVELVIDVS